ncbi:PREDICTED: alpha-aspartyl dipeptidase-like isoform X1 [Priapulus caudatus]|uniref:Alpha-aspartyl dipeptidase-like isoform X1 n=1 Tax=Priapulus caudatus TaxID=37621 RepID=A0ABM1EJU1_PRICU|nr:PREDICTED: alpha-aspartyl dipeptidase-like isoform X1 [Priapulus caudatus]
MAAPTKSSRKLLLLSNSTSHGGGYLDYCEQQIKDFLGRNVKKVVFVPYALTDRDWYTDIARKRFAELGYEVQSVHECSSPVEAVEQAEAIFIGGGNTFRLLKTLYDEKLVEPIRTQVLKHSIPYIGSSAGTNVATATINTTNDMPITCPPTFEALALIPFNINPHYIDSDPSSKHMGETREKRIMEYHEEAHCRPVLALREGSILWVEGNKTTLLGGLSARLFRKGELPAEYSPGDDLSFLLTAGL